MSWPCSLGTTAIKFVTIFPKEGCVVLRAVAHWGPFAWQNNKTVLLYFTQNSVSEIQCGTSVQRSWVLASEWWCSNLLMEPRTPEVDMIYPHSYLLWAMFSQHVSCQPLAQWCLDNEDISHTKHRSFWYWLPQIPLGHSFWTAFDSSLSFAQSYLPLRNWKGNQSCLTLCNPMDYSPPGPSVLGICARFMEWVAIPFSRGSSPPRDQTWASCIAGRFLTTWATREA